MLTRHDNNAAWTVRGRRTSVMSGNARDQPLSIQNEENIGAITRSLNNLEFVDFSEKMFICEYSGETKTTKSTFMGRYVLLRTGTYLYPD